MAEILISNTGPLIALGLIHKLDLLREFYDEVWIAETVNREISSNTQKPLANLVRQCPFIKIQPNPEMPDRWLETQLDLGEATTIALSLQQSNRLVMIDEKKGRNIASQVYQLPVIGSLGILSMAKKSGLIQHVAPFLYELKTKNYRISDNLIDMVLHDLGETELKKY